MITILRRGFLSIAAVTALSMQVPAAAQAQATVAKIRAVFQVSDADPQRWNLALNNVRNVADELGQDAVELEIVVYGPGIGMLKRDSAVGKRVADALGSGVRIVACENSWTNERYGYVNNVYVAPALRGQNLGAELMLHADDFFRGRGIHRLRLTVTAANEAATALYHSNGYRVTRWEMEKEI